MTREPQTPTVAWDVALANRLQQLADAGCKTLTMLQIHGLIAFVRDGEGTALPAPVAGAREALEKIAKQKTKLEWESEFGEEFSGDFVTGYDAIIGIARNALAALPSPPEAGPVAWRVRLLSGHHQVTSMIEHADMWREGGAVVESLYAAPQPVVTGDLREECANLQFMNDSHEEEIARLSAQVEEAPSSVESAEVALGDIVCVNEQSPYFHDWKGTKLKVVSLRIDPNGKHWVSVIEGQQRHRGNGVYDGETTDFDADHLTALAVSRPMRCEGCDQNYADPPSKLCPGCQAYREHQR